MKPFSWGDLDPSEVWPYVDPNDEREPDEDEPPGLPMTLGPASNSGAPAYNPMSVEAPGIDPGGSLLAENLSWKV